jgi:hypothetical protein
LILDFAGLYSLRCRSLPTLFTSDLRPSFNSDGSKRGELRTKSVRFAEAERRLHGTGTSFREVNLWYITAYRTV